MTAIKNIRITKNASNQNLTPLNFSHYFVLWHTISQYFTLYHPALHYFALWCTLLHVYLQSMKPHILTSIQYKITIYKYLNVFR